MMAARDAKVIRPAGFVREPLRVDDPAGGAAPAPGGGHPGPQPPATPPTVESSNFDRVGAAGGGVQPGPVSRPAQPPPRSRRSRSARRQQAGGEADQPLPPRRHEATEALYADLPMPEAERFSEAAFKLGRRPPINGKRVAKHDLLGALIWKYVGTSSAQIDGLYELVEEWHTNRTVKLRD